MLRAGLYQEAGQRTVHLDAARLRVLRKVENIVREEMDKSGGIELLMPAVQPPSCGRKPGAGRCSARRC